MAARALASAAVTLRRKLFVRQEILSTCWSSEEGDRPTFTQLAGMLERLPKLNRRLSHPGHF